MKKIFFLSFIFFSVIVRAQNKQPSGYVNPFIGVSTSAYKTSIHHSLGKTFLRREIKEDNKTVVYKDSVATSFFKRTKGVIAMDGGFTVTLNDGKVLWLFGDSYIDHYDSITHSLPCLFQARNSALLQPSANDWNWHNTVSLIDSNSNDKTFLKYKEHPDHFFWPASGYQLKDTIFIYGMNMKNVKGGLGFGKAGNDVWIKLSYPSFKIIDIKELSSAMDSIRFGCGLITNNNDGYAYIYGTKQKLISSGLYVARFPVDHPANAWSFWNGSSWSDDIREAKEITTTPSNSTTVSKVKNKYVALTAEFSLGCDGGKNIYASTSDHIEGPFSKPKIIYTINDTLQGHYPFFYLPIAHPRIVSMIIMNCLFIIQLTDMNLVLVIAEIINLTLNITGHKPFAYL